MLRCVSRAIAAACAGVALCAGVGCGGVDLTKSSRLSVGDMRLIVDETVQSLAASDWVASRSADSPRATVTFGEMVNVSDDVITRSELWYLAQAVAGEVFGNRELRQGKNIVLVVPAERLDAARRRGSFDVPVGGDREVTHVMSCEIDTVARSEGDSRTDLYRAEYTLLNLGTAEIEWIGRVTFERRALGRSFN